MAITRAGNATHTLSFQPEGAPPTEVQLLPAKVFTGLDGRGPYDATDMAGIISRTIEKFGGNDLPIDFGHELEEPGVAGASARAAGWIRTKDLFDRDGQLWAPTDWTWWGGTQVMEKSFRYLSPVFAHDTEGRVLYVLRAGLTNRPNLVMTAVNSQQEDTELSDTLKQRVAAALGLAVTETDDNLVARCTASHAGVGRIAGALQLQGAATVDEIVARCTTVSAAAAALPRVAEALKLAPTATPESVIATAAAALSQQPDPNQWVTRAHFDRVATELTAAQTQIAEATVDALVKDGKLTPAQRDWAIGYHRSSPDQFKAFMAGAPVIAGNVTTPPAGGAAAGGKLTPEELAVCSSLGISEEDFIKNKGGE